MKTLYRLYLEADGIPEYESLLTSHGPVSLRKIEGMLESKSSIYTLNKEKVTIGEAMKGLGYRFIIRSVDN